MIGLLRRLAGEFEAADAISRTHIKMALDLLTDDDDDETDIQGWDKLSETLFKAGDSVNSEAAYTLRLFRAQRIGLGDTSRDGS